MKRLGYRKSRNGCTRCKKRRVKCDEKKPCTACVRHELPCSLENSEQQSSPSSPTRAQRSSGSPGHRSTQSFPPASVFAFEYQTGSLSPGTLSSPSATEAVGDHHSGSDFGREQISPPSQPDPFSYISRFLTVLNQSEPASGWIPDLELMHHYSSITYQTVAQSTLVQKALQYDIPRVALSYPFLLHQILAFSAYHLAYLEPNSRQNYLLHAAQHQNNAINGMRGTLVGTISSSNCHALYASSIFLTFSAFATYPVDEKYNPSFSPIDSILDIFNLTIGMATILRTSEDDLRNGPLREMFHHGPGDKTPSAVRPTLKPLFDRLSRLSSEVLELGLVDNKERITITDTIRALKVCIAKVSFFDASTVSAEIRAIFLLPGVISSDYLNMLRCRHPAALVVLAHYCVIIHSAELFCWYLSGWPKSLISAISEQVDRGPWAELARWPIEVIGLEDIGKT
ncbi:fungal Zn binuclear cluster domain-containing protein [Colletotrichum truncatum]|uniref:Fungal Zn binuclear cluster domain-containing protein n=1 Tax=Colletotrichum truncatum TaxID=5467 RepID=A0ACC3YQ11_COLTU|nr:fungal Zn binuclear cluster domain-containing protein [Colletotrichum truncatum]KAF6796735.1 fungal Zn binuclear cluster domain-containing protein [Colletotrichum truncatum]